MSGRSRSPRTRAAAARLKKKALQRTASSSPAPSPTANNMGKHRKDTQAGDVPPAHANLAGKAATPAPQGPPANETTQPAQAKSKLTTPAPQVHKTTQPAHPTSNASGNASSTSPRSSPKPWTKNNTDTPPINVERPESEEDLRRFVTAATRNLDYHVKIAFKTHVFTIQCFSDEDATKATAALEDLKAGFHTFTGRRQRQLRLVMKGLPTYISDDTIKEELLQVGLTTELISRYTMRDGKPSDAILIAFTNGTDPQKVRSIRSISHIIIRWESIRRQPGRVLYCTKCLRLGHLQNRCFHAPKCGKCGDEHLSSSCAETTLYCGPCNQAGHTATDPACPSRLKYQERMRHRSAQQPGRSSTQQPERTNSHGHQRQNDDNNRRVTAPAAGTDSSSDRRFPPLPQPSRDPRLAPKTPQPQTDEQRKSAPTPAKSAEAGVPPSPSSPKPHPNECELQVQDLLDFLNERPDMVHRKVTPTVLVRLTVDLLTKLRNARHEPESIRLVVNYMSIVFWGHACRTRT